MGICHTNYQQESEMAKTEMLNGYCNDFDTIEVREDGMVDLTVQFLFPSIEAVSKAVPLTKEEVSNLKPGVFNFVGLLQRNDQKRSNRWVKLS
jgi:hypothetical protein